MNMSDSHEVKPHCLWKEGGKGRGASFAFGCTIRAIALAKILEQVQMAY